MRGWNNRGRETRKEAPWGKGHGEYTEKGGDFYVLDVTDLV
jgi:hypothetical protein